MLEILQYIFSSFWVWLGTVILVYAIAEGISGVIDSVVWRQYKQISVSDKTRREIEE